MRVSILSVLAVGVFVLAYLLARRLLAGVAQARLEMLNESAGAVVAGRGRRRRALPRGVASNATVLLVRRANGRRTVHELREVGAGARGRNGDRSVYTPTVLGVKLVAAYLSEDITPETGTNIGQTEMIYLNPECLNGIGACGVEAFDPELLNEGVLEEQYVRVSSYFNFAQPTEVVNAQLNAQQHPLTPGTYRYLRLEFCRSGSNTTNARFQAGDMGSPHVFGTSSCAVTTELSPPLVLGAGDVVTIALSYVVDDIVYDGGSSTAGNCTGGTPNYCVQLPSFLPTLEGA